ncbi:MAG: hypothetical protein ACK45U_09960 [bacterium]|jgi:hypothetical protein
MKTVVSLVALFISCSLYAQTAVDAVLFGTVKNEKYNSIQLEFRNNPIDTINYVLTINLNDKGQFYETLPIKKPIAGSLIIGSDTISVYIEVSESIEIIYSNTNSIEFKSKYFNNNYVLAHQKKYYDQINKLIQKNSINDFKKYSSELDSITNQTLQELKLYASKNIISASFLKYQRAKYIYNSANRKYDYLKHHKLLDFKYENTPENESYLFYDKLSATQSDLLLMNEYIEYLLKRHKYNYYQSDLSSLNEQEQMRLKFKLVSDMYEGRELYFVLTKVMAEILEDYSYLYAKSLVSEYMSTVSIVEYRKFIDKKIQLAIRRLE